MNDRRISIGICCRWNFVVNSQAQTTVDHKDESHPARLVSLDFVVVVVVVVVIYISLAQRA